ncbi:hexosaminidase [Gillisia mitskevichiae]|uniref:beta-N-acetylhexosaminidase n=1 Tax=Gillisia mitskevichiae TaxID=270921 RepID=A0A495PW53_9FLAO|nr:family 20 glycosylhydrolase [Gillisia mitskevichiae]RKS55372.1 hexosaminidase [Gillisia mitskevichiae]
MKCFIQNILLLFLVVFTFGCSTSNSFIANNTSNSSIAIIPKPQILAINDGTYVLPKVNNISFSGSSIIAAELLKELLQKANLNTVIKDNSDSGNFKLIADLSLEKQLGAVGYILDINENGVIIKAVGETGLFYGIQSLRQLLPAGLEDGSFNSRKITLPKLHLQDSPKYTWRGSMIDIARSYFGVEYLKAHLDRMALYKMNRLHLHLTDDQGWRLQLKSKPRLTEIGAKGSVKNGRSGYLSIEEYKELQVYAKQNHIVIIPEIDLPGHIYAALVSYPELNCEALSNLNPKMVSPPELFDGYKVGWSKLCLTNPETYNFVADVLQEVSELTDGPWIHIGGDEIKDDLYKTFVVKADSIVRSNGKTPIGWEEVSKAKVSKELISQRWNGKTAPLNKSKVIESICTSFYLDHANVTGQENTNNWCKKTGVSLEDVYNFKDKEEEIIGVEAPVWTELVVTDAMLDNRLWPRLIAVAEIGWSQSHNDFKEFTQRLKQHKSRLEALGINYYPSLELNWNDTMN